MHLILIAIGGALGSVTRYLSSELILQIVKFNNSSLAKFPWPTFCVNVLGSLLAGAAYFFVIKNFDNFDPRLKNFLFVGFLGGFTTFSAFSLDFFRLATAGQYSQALLYALASVTISILALFFGFYLSKLIFS
ncbi:MAG: fluoride efflux transporter CrcB [Rickettsiales bacterium]|nr:fluoride efflux transporter CrcB [Rickettsiales bacterium]